MYDIWWAPQLISKDSILQQNITKASSILQTESSLKEEYLKFEVTSNQNEETWELACQKIVSSEQKHVKRDIWQQGNNKV